MSAKGSRAERAKHELKNFLLMWQTHQNQWINFPSKAAKKEKGPEKKFPLHLTRKLQALEKPSRNEFPAARLVVIERSNRQSLFNRHRAGGQVGADIFSEPAAYSLSLMKLIKTICIYYCWGLRKLFFNLLWSFQLDKWSGKRKRIEEDGQEGYPLYNQWGWL